MSDKVLDIRDLPMDEVATRAAQLDIYNVGINKQVEILSEEFKYKFTRTQVERLKYKEVYARVKEEYTKTIVKQAVSQLKEGTGKLIPKVLKALEDALDKGNISAVTPTLKILGVETAEPETKQAQQLTVVLPGRREKDVSGK